MALQGEVNTDFGIKVDNAYHRVESVTVSKKGMVYCVKSYADVNVRPIREVSQCYEYMIDGGNPFQQAYDHMKTLPEYAGCVDC